MGKHNNPKQSNQTVIKSFFKKTTAFIWWMSNFSY